MIALVPSWLFLQAHRLLVDVGRVIRATPAFLEHGRFPPPDDRFRRARPFRAGARDRDIVAGRAPF